MFAGFLGVPSVLISSINSSQTLHSQLTGLSKLKTQFEKRGHFIKMKV